ncbi:MAG: hypothetical protein ACLP1X_03490 [Polyangiaceae bacterium]
MLIQNLSRVTLALVAGGIVVGCASSAPPKSTAETASAWARSQCAAFRDDTTIADILSGKAVERVDPLYVGVQSKSSSPRLEGAVLTVRPIRGATAEWLDRSLECHGVERMLGTTAALGGAVDPFVLPGSMISIHVHSAGDGFRIDLAGTSTEEAREILSRTDTFFSGHHRGEAVATDLSGQ